MSEQIIATGFTDPLLAGIRAQVAAKTDHIPFLLLPVKIETRFMKVDKPLTEKDPFPDVLTDLAKLEDYMRVDVKNMPAQEVIGRGNKMLEMMSAVKENATGIKRFSSADREALLQRIQTIQKENESIVATLNKFKAKDETTDNDLRSIRIQLASAFTTLSRTIENLQPGAGTDETLPMTRLLEFFGSLGTAMDQLGTRDFSTDDYKLKRTLFTFADDQLAKIELAMKDIRKMMSMTFKADEGQLKQLDVLSKQFLRSAAKAQRNIINIKSKFKVTEYSERLVQLVKTFEALQKELNEVLKP